MTDRSPDAGRGGASRPLWRPAPRGPFVLALALALALGALALIWLLARPLALLFSAIVIAESLAPIVGWLARWLPRWSAIGAVYLGLALAAGAVGWLVVPPMIDQAEALIQNGPDLAEQSRTWLRQLDPTEQDRIVAVLLSRLDELGSLLVSVPVAVVSAATEVLLVLVMSIYWLAEGPALRRFTLSLVPAERRSWAAAVLREMGRTMGGYVRGVVIDAAVMAVLTYPGLVLIGVRFPLVLALLTGVGELVPIIGPIIAAIPALAIALTASPTQALQVLVFFVVLQQIESNLLTPNIMRRQTDVPQLLILFALLAGGAVGGILGALVAIPLAGAARVLVLRVVTPLVLEWTGAAEG